MWEPENNYNGLIVQKIKRKTISSSPEYLKNDSLYNHSYLEYWEVTNGTLPKVFGKYFHDNWEYWRDNDKNISSFLSDCIDKYNKNAVIQMQGDVYLVSCDHSRYDEIKMTFRAGAVKYAGSLPSIKDISYESELHKELEHNFEHGWDFTTDDNYLEAVKEGINYTEILDIIAKYKTNLIYNDLRTYLFP